MKKIYFILLVLLPTFIGHSQDIHWSQINENSLYQNPANTGFINQDFRGTLSSRDQWRNITKPFQSQTITFDMVNKYNRKLGYGGCIIHDVTGDGIYRTIEARITSAYSLIETKKANYKLRLGIDLGWRNNQMDYSKYMFDNQFDGFIFSKYIVSNENYTTQKKSYFTLGTGLLLSKAVSTKFLCTIGFALFNINEPNQGFYNQKIARKKRFTNYIQGEWYLSKNIKLYPAINFSYQNNASELIIGSKCNFFLSEKILNHPISLGTYLRFKDAFIFLFGLNFKQLSTSISYDINFSKLAKVSNGRGALELHLQYLWNRKDETNLMHKRCLDYL